MGSLYDEEKTHPSYGMIQIDKFSSNGSTFFNSDIVQNSGVSITIFNATVHSSKSGVREHILAEDEIIRVRLSSNQFVDAITSGMNAGGSPCTIVHKGDGMIEPDEFLEDKKKQFTEHMAEIQSEYMKKIKALDVKITNSKMGKRVAEDIKHDLHTLKMHMESNNDYVMSRFESAMEKVVTEAKHSVSSYIDNKISSLGMEALIDKHNLVSLDGIKPMEIENENQSD